MITRERSRRFPYLSVMGPAGVGKTTLAKIVAPSLSFRLFTEEAATQENPFLAGSYRDPERWSLPSQVHFLLSKVQQLRRVGPVLREEPVFQEPPMDEDVEVYARARLKGKQWRLYHELFQELTEVGVYPRPDLVVSLEVNFDHLMGRLRRRAEEEGGARLAELDIHPDYWRTMIQLNRQWADQTEIPVLRLDTNGVNYVDSLEDQTQVVGEIRIGVFRELWEKGDGVALDGCHLILPESLHCPQGER